MRKSLGCTPRPVQRREITVKTRGHILAAWGRVPPTVRLAAVLLLGVGLLNCLLTFTPSMRATNLVPPAEVRGLMRLGVGLLGVTILVSLQPWAWLLVLAASVVPVVVTIILLAQQLRGEIPSFLGQVQYVGPVYLTIAAIDLAVAILLLLPQSREAFAHSADPLPRSES